VKSFNQRYPFLIFLLLMIGQMVLFYILYYIPALQSKVFSHLVNLYADISSKVLNLFGYRVSVTGDSIYSAQFSISIKKGCDALEPMALITAGIIAFPSPVKFKMRGLLIGLSFLFLLNIIRIVTLFQVGVYNQNLFETMHIDIWQIIFILSGIVYWFAWVKKAVKKKKQSS
jgi:exosortase H (IPTLxxWG-CTERM-specific)